MTNILLYFKNINSIKNKVPFIQIYLNGESVHTGEVKTVVDLAVETLEKNIIEIKFINKTDKDVIIDHKGNIIADLNFELEKILFDNIDIEHLKWESYYDTGVDKIQGCLFFGPAGKFVMQFEMPILRWILKTNHDKNNNDPNWEEDYHYYSEAWNKIQKK